ncbi:cold shock domain-containing protein [Pseudoflavitalea sp. G-6-1-2]|uniref:cold-shock protein n=1 Tax=Pseudoflavitalea sp. G-6-1-2 TaxID=2728841 RepID=UPI00146E1952|nr:cold shock domain-containing protein [Pseudoflavitalea sp. G-6-1-2]NML21194.1 cold shock domain-containing protein [Pseudoflavitalea sp. G-6-1-2]
MAKSKETFNKREKEKQRMKKQQEKLEKKKERKINKEQNTGSGFVMAYLDENGNLTDTPPDPSKKKVFLQEDIQIGVPKASDIEEDPIHLGTVNFFNHQKGFGFIIDNATKERIFVHANDINVPLNENDKVSFEIARGHKGLVAVNVSLVK